MSPTSSSSRIVEGLFHGAPASVLLLAFSLGLNARVTTQVGFALHNPLELERRQGSDSVVGQSQQSVRRRRRIAGEGSNGLGLRTQQQIKCDDVRDHPHGHVDNRDSVGGAQLSRQLFLHNHKPLWVRRYVLCSVRARQRWFVTVF